MVAQRPVYLTIHLTATCQVWTVSLKAGHPTYKPLAPDTGERGWWVTEAALCRSPVQVKRSVLASTMPAWAAAQPTTSSAAAPVASQAAVRGHMMDSRKGKNDAGIRGHGFVADNGVCTTIDAPGAGLSTVVFGIDESGKTVGGYIDDRGRLHGFLRDKEAFTVIDFPGARATVASKINAQGQIIGAYSENSNTPALDLPQGFLLDKGVFTKIDFPGAVRTQPFGINNRGQIVDFYLGINEGQ